MEVPSTTQEFIMNTQQLHAFLVKNQDKDRAWLSKATGKTTRTINEHQAKLRALGKLPENTQKSIKVSVLDPEQQFQIDMEKLRLKHQEKGTDKKYQIAMAEINKLRDENEKLTEMKGTVASYEITAKTSHKHEAVAFAILSDTHIEENVKPESVDGANEYNLRIAKSRMEAFFINTVKLVGKEQQDANIDTLVLALLGDLISSNIHDELMESCEVPPVEAAVIAQNFITSGIDYILKHTKLKLIVPCCVGNHSRITHQVHVSTEQGNSLEWMIYCNLASHYKNNKRVTFVLSKSYFTWVKVFDYDIRFHHGHAMKYGGGIGSITIPVLKAIARYDVAKKAYLDVFGHFHNPMDGGKFVSNGCMIGDTPYGKRLGFTGKPQQQFFLIDKKYGKTIVAPIFLGP
jgi:hypothetical protein